MTIASIALLALVFGCAEQPETKDELDQRLQAAVVDCGFERLSLRAVEIEIIEAGYPSHFKGLGRTEGQRLRCVLDRLDNSGVRRFRFAGEEMDFDVFRSQLPEQEDQ